ncbi:hypothetical protein Tco_0003108 [Tanacetum coccineum]
MLGRGWGTSLTYDWSGNFIQDTTERFVLNQCKGMQAVQRSTKVHYAVDRKRISRMEFKVGDRVMLKVSHEKESYGSAGLPQESERVHQLSMYLIWKKCLRRRTISHAVRRFAGTLGGAIELTWERED